MAKLTNAVKTTIRHLMGKGLNTAAAIGVCGNIKAESGFRTDAVGDNGTSFGICQWHNNRGSNMKKFVGSDWKNDLTGQLDFLWHELSNSYKGVLKSLKGVDNTKAGCKKAADVFVRKFEVPANVDKQSEKRQQNAVEYWNASNGGTSKDLLPFEPWPLNKKVVSRTSDYGGWFTGKNPYASPNGNCTHWAYGRFCMIANKWVKRDGDEDAWGFWKGSDGHWGFPTCEHGQTPQLGAIGVWGDTRAGHVAVVEVIYKNGDIGVSEAGYGNGWLGSRNRLKKSKNYANPMCTSGTTLRGFVYNPGVSGGYITSGGGGGGGEDTGGPLDLRQAISKLYSSDNYEFIYSGGKDEKSPTQVLRESLQKIIDKIKKDHANIPTSDTTGGTASWYSDVTTEDTRGHEAKTVKYTKSYGDLSTSPILVQAPYVELTMNGVKIGGYNASDDKYPNHIVGLTVEKINNKINTYTIQLIHQVRTGEDPNIIDALLNRTGYRNKVKIKYGDSATGLFFKEEEAYIMDVSYNENVQSANIAYTIKAVSSVSFVKYSYFSYPPVTGKPSTEINNLMYHSGQSSIELQNSFSGMRTAQDAMRRNAIPTNDAVVNIPGLANASPYDRLNQLVANMRDPNDATGTYMLSYNDATNDASFRIVEVTRQDTADRNALIKNCYTLDIGFPGNTMITSFALGNDVYWPLYYKYAGKIASYKYDIDYNGKITRSKVNPLDVDDKFQSKNVESMNWWEYVRSYPVSATVTIKGLMKPVLLMENVYIFSQIYGQEDLASGLYSIIGQTDTIDGGGCSTTLELLKISYS